jgi:hypothetical protein
MSTSTKSVPRTVAVLGLPEYEVPRFVTVARAMVQAMTNNPRFPSPDPPLATLSAAIEALDQAEVARQLGTVGAVARRNEKRTGVKSLLERLRSHVQAVADADPENAASVIESAGMSVQKKRRLPPRVFAAKPGDVSGSVRLFAPKAGHRAAYDWAYSTDGGTTWTSLPQTVQASTTVYGLLRGTMVLFRYRATTKDGVGDWSEPVAILVE